MEWDTVYHLDKQLLSKEEQDLNLKYVITTRAKQELFEINHRGYCNGESNAFSPGIQRLL